MLHRQTILLARICPEVANTDIMFLKKLFKGPHIYLKTRCLHLIINLIFSIIMLFNPHSWPLNIFPMKGNSTFGSYKHISTNLDFLLCRCGLVWYMPKWKWFVIRGNIVGKIRPIILIMSCQKDFTITHSHIQ